MSISLEDLSKFLNECNELNNKIPIKEKTYMEVSGYPHYENVCSNILAFYFNPNEEHNMNDLVIKAFAEVIKSKDINIKEFDTSYFEIQREYSTLKGNRIDLVLKNEDIIIGIENKIYASLYNDLLDYSKTIDNLVNNQQTVKVVLSMNNNEENVKNTDFINITYREFFDKLKPMLNNIYKKNKWFIYLQEFIKNLENYKGDIEMEEDILKFMQTHQKEIDDFSKIKSIVNGNIRKKEYEIKEILENKHNFSYIKIWDGDLEKSCYIDSPKKYHVDATLSYTGWKIGIFTWTKANSDIIKRIIDNSKYNLIDDDGNHRWLFKYDYDENYDTIIDKMIELYNYFENNI